VAAVLFVFHGLVQFSDAKLRPFYFSLDAVSTDHYPAENLYHTSSGCKPIQKRINLQLD